MDRTHLPSLGLVLIGLMMAVFGTMDALGGQMVDVPMMALSALGLCTAAFALRDHVAFPGEPLVAVGTTVWGVAQCVKFVLLAATPGVYLVPFGLLAVGSVIAALGAWRWKDAMRSEEVSRMLPLRIGLGVFGLGLVGLMVLQLSSGSFGLPLLLLSVGTSGSLLFVLSFTAATPATEGPPSQESGAAS